MVTSLSAARTLRPTLCRSVALFALSGLASTACAASLSFDDALALAVRETPVLRSVAAQSDAARKTAIPAGELPDPKLVLGIDNLPIEGADRFSLTGDGMTMQRLGLMQEFPNAAKRAARVSAAQGRVAQAEAQTRITRLAVLRETAVAWIARDAVERQLARIDSLEGENHLLDAVVRARIAGGKGSALEALASRQEAAMIDARRDELTARRQQAIAALRRWVGPRAEAPLEGSVPDWPVVHGKLAHALHDHPELAIFEPRGRVLDAEAAEARAEKKPDWTLELAYQKRGARFGDMAMVQVSFDLPVFAAARQDPKIAARLAEREGLDAEREAVLREHAAMLETDFAEHQRLALAVKRQREVLLPLAGEKVDLALAAWRSGKGELVDLVMARRERIDAELMAIALEGERRQLAARLLYAYSEPDLTGEKQ
ncbi:heavy metal RND efflux outer membrane protein, CzcC family [Thiobacillus denitrificans ATCC 25259]|uniref:Heavy metal RND efflux outer membrane protein, CzcC family n=1 Tax=Thiobacillus denitrificans (strain ATCC 25259 / T1) TaxID=292415 RepID=Q3SJ79_THIDA|nr:TolC family protein [Thiobacillus denitrificans]AAZ97288.1 heavy metal RND efflux outer membrane protein, CzcC family [Thiobacillus denitrificans ATCC 25259]